MQDSEDEANAFTQTFEAAGGQIVSVVSYPRRTTSFEQQMRSIASLRPDALVLPLPPEDVELLAPQITFFGLDTLNVRVLGTAGWTREEVLAKVATRHTDGVVAVSPDPLGQGESEGAAALVKAYEGLFRRTLRSPVPAVGYDAAALLLRALGGGARTPARIATALEGIDDYSGATGDLGVSDGRLVRRYRLVCVQSRRLEAISVGRRPTLVDRRPSVAPGEKPPAVEGPPLQVYCPGFEPARP